MSHLKGQKSQSFSRQKKIRPTGIAKIIFNVRLKGDFFFYNFCRPLFFLLIDYFLLGLSICFVVLPHMHRILCKYEFSIMVNNLSVRSSKKRKSSLDKQMAINGLLSKRIKDK